MCIRHVLQDYEIECPDTKTKFSLKTGEITDWWAPPPLPVEFSCPPSIQMCPGYAGVQAATCCSVMVFTVADTTHILCSGHVKPITCMQVPHQSGAQGNHTQGHCQKHGHLPSETDPGGHHGGCQRRSHNQVPRRGAGRL